jgi:DNA-binding response OmpR family regulator
MPQWRRGARGSDPSELMHGKRSKVAPHGLDPANTHAHDRDVMRYQGGTAEEPSRIMVVEDNEALAGLLRRALEQAGHEVVLAPSGLAMMRLVHITKPDLIVFDIALPDVDGRDLLAALKKDARTFSIPVVIWSGRYADSDRAVALDLGAEDYVEKGPPLTLVPKIQRILLRLSERELKQARKSIDPKT